MSGWLSKLRLFLSRSWRIELGKEAYGAIQIERSFWTRKGADRWLVTVGGSMARTVGRPLTGRRWQETPEGEIVRGSYGFRKVEPTL